MRTNVTKDALSWAPLQEVMPTINDPLHRSDVSSLWLLPLLGDFN